MNSESPADQRTDPGATQSGEWLRAGDVRDFEVGSLGASRIDGRRICIGRNEDGYFAVDDVCPHAGASLAGGFEHKGELICPLHAWGFDLRSGECADAAGTRIDVHEARVVGNEIQVRLRPLLTEKPTKHTGENP